MKDPRHEKLARLLTEYSVALKPGDIVAIQGDASTAPVAARMLPRGVALRRICDHRRAH